MNKIYNLFKNLKIQNFNRILKLKKKEIGFIHLKIGFRQKLVRNQ
jgi:hypothetical protein